MVAFQSIGWKKTEAQYRRYVEEQAAGWRLCRVAFARSRRSTCCRNFGGRELPAGGLMMSRHSRWSSSVVGIGVGLHPGYNAAQRLHSQRGYIPDGRGIRYRDRCLEEGAQIVLDDDLVLHLAKQHRPELRWHSCRRARIGAVH